MTGSNSTWVKPMPLHIWHQPLGQHVPAGAVVLRQRQPGSGVNFIDRRSAPTARCVPSRARRQSRIAEAERLGADDDRRRLGRRFGRPTRRVGLQRQHLAPRPRATRICKRAGRKPRDEQLPHARLDALAHRVAPPVPAVEVADHRDAPRIRRPHGEADALHAVDPHRVRAEAAAEIVVPAFREQMDVEIAQQQRGKE